MKLASLLQEELIICGGEAGTYEEGRDLLINKLVAFSGADKAGLREGILEREALASVVVAPGVAFPHARVDCVSDFYILIGTFPEGLEVEGGDPVKLIVIYFMPEGLSNLYLRAMSAMAKFLAKQPDALQKLMEPTTGAELLKLIEESGVSVKDVVTAQDIMSADSPSVSEAESLRQVADLMVKHNVTTVPVVDGEGSYLGLVRAGSLLKVGVPDYLLQMDSVDFLTDFEPFQDLLKKEQSMTVAEIMEREALSFPVDTPMIQVAAKLIGEKVSCAPVLRESGELAGMISMIDFVHKVVRA